MSFGVRQLVGDGPSFAKICTARAGVIKPCEAR